MAYFLDFDERALKEWRKLGSTVREQLKRSWLKYLSHPGLKQTSSVVCLIVTRLSSGLQAIALYTEGYRRESCRFRDFCWEKRTLGSI